MAAATSTTTLLMMVKRNEAAAALRKSSMLNEIESKAGKQISMERPVLYLRFAALICFVVLSAFQATGATNGRAVTTMRSRTVSGSCPMHKHGGASDKTCPMRGTCPMCGSGTMTSAAMCAAGGTRSLCRGGSGSARKCSASGSCSLCAGMGVAMSARSCPMSRPTPKTNHRE